VGVIVPDLVLKRGRDRVFVELLGFWSRDAVWKRVELVEAGLSERVVFCASERLRVREAVLDDDRASLYVWKGVPQPKKVLDRALRWLGRAPVIKKKVSKNVGL
jgi:predicted nuclease of restriction endonuclease-like RecB superfamily